MWEKGEGKKKTKEKKRGKDGWFGVMGDFDPQPDIVLINSARTEMTFWARMSCSLPGPLKCFKFRWVRDEGRRQ